jgi:hypothetical protein
MNFKVLAKLVVKKCFWDQFCKPGLVEPDHYTIVKNKRLSESVSVKRFYYWEMLL